VAERAEVVGIQPKRAPVLLAGVVAIGELMDQTGFSQITVSESDLLMGLSITLDAVSRDAAGAEASTDAASPVGWACDFARW
jgi:exopolyphosphatase/guanosine-5'-triphosphate,3'-diphosphate pyrophosphatase